MDEHMDEYMENDEGDTRSENGIHTEGETFEPWPDFSTKGLFYCNGVHASAELDGILEGDDAASRAWCAHMPPPVLAMVRAYPDLRAELIELAERDTEGVLRLYRRNSALLKVVAGLDFHLITIGRDLLDEAIVKEQLRLLSGPPREILGALALPTERGLARIFSRLPARHASLQELGMLVIACRTPKLLARLRHVPKLNGEVLELLEGLSHSICDVPLLNLAAQKPRKDGLSISEVVRGIVRTRASMRIDPWPYRGWVNDWARLRRAHLRTLEKFARQLGPFPQSPVATDLAHVPEGFAPEAMETVAAVYAETLGAGLNPEEEIRAVLDKESYVFRVTMPERLTLVVRKIPGEGWHIWKALSPELGSLPTPDTEALFCAWMKNSGFLQSRALWREIWE